MCSVGRFGKRREGFDGDGLGWADFLGCFAGDRGGAAGGEGAVMMVVVDGGV